MQRNRGVVFVLAVLVSAGCQSGPETRPTGNTDDVWPGAPNPTVSGGPRTFRYQPANMGRYRIIADGIARGPVQEAFSATADFEFRPGSTPDERDVHVVTMNGMIGNDHLDLAMQISSDEYYERHHGQETHVFRFQRAGLDVAALTETPFAIATFDPDANTIRVRPRPEYPLATFIADGEMLDEALLVFPDLSREPIAVGHHWSMTRNVPVSASGARADVTIEVKYVGDGRCRSGVGACALLSFTGSTPGIEVVGGKGAKVRMVFGVTGKAFFNYERGTLDEARVRTMVTGELASTKATYEENFKLEPRP